MAVICLTSASGSPGVTTTAVGLAFCWPRPVLLVEADPTGGSGILAGFLKGTTPYDAGLVELALSPLSTADALRDVVRPLSPSVSLVAGTRTHAQAAALRDVWEPLDVALARTGCQRAGRDRRCRPTRTDGIAQPLLDSADATLLGHPREPAVDLRGSFMGRDGSPARDGLAAPRTAPDRRGPAVQGHRGVQGARHARCRRPSRRSCGRCGLPPRSASTPSLRDRSLHPGTPRGGAVGPGARRARPVRPRRGGHAMTEASRFLSEYGDLSRLPLFSQSANGATPPVAELGVSGHHVPRRQLPTSTGPSSPSCAPGRPSS